MAEEYRPVENIFVGRKWILEQLENMYNACLPRFNVIKGRRRIGKTELIKKFAANKPFLMFTAEAPSVGDSMVQKLAEFREQLQRYVQEPVPVFANWFWALDFLKKILKPGMVVLFDEISWMAHGAPDLPAKLKNWWDEIDHSGMHVVVFVCGSVSTWIEKNIIKSTALFGRMNLKYNLPPLTINESAELLKDLGFAGSGYEYFKIMSVFGGVPAYLKLVQPYERANDVIKRLCFQSNAALLNEFQLIFHDLFNGETLVSRLILEALEPGGLTVDEIRKAINYQNEDKMPLQSFLENLETAGFVWGYSLWNMATGTQTDKFIYYIVDPFIRFYLKSIAVHEQQIRLGDFSATNAPLPPGLFSRIGFQLESLLLVNRQFMLDALGLNPYNVVYHGPYRQLGTKSSKGCQIDYLVQTVDKTLFLCEFKFMHGALGSSIIQEVQQKIDRLKVLHGFSVVPVLFHIGGVVDAVKKQKFFYKIIDIGAMI